MRVMRRSLDAMRHEVTIADWQDAAEEEGWDPFGGVCVCDGSENSSIIQQLDPTSSTYPTVRKY